MHHGRAACTLALLIAIGCGPGVEIPADFEGYTEARTPCVLSHDHSLRYVRVFADDDALGPYTRADAPYPTGARLLKAEYDDDACSELLGYVLMTKLEPGTASFDRDWDWARFDAEGQRISDPRFIPSTCVDCHTWHCAAPPYGWDFTCTEGAPEPPPP